MFDCVHKIVYTNNQKETRMTFEWDENKNKINKKKHGVSFEMAVRVFLDEKRIEKIAQSIQRLKRNGRML